MRTRWSSSYFFLRTMQLCSHVERDAEQILCHGLPIRPLRSDTLSNFLHALSWTRLEMATGDARKHEKCTLADEPRQGHGRMSGSSPRSKQMRHSTSAMGHLAPRNFSLSTYALSGILRVKCIPATPEESDYCTENFSA